MMIDLRQKEEPIYIDQSTVSKEDLLNRLTFHVIPLGYSKRLEASGWFRVRGKPDFDVNTLISNDSFVGTFYVQGLGSINGRVIATNLGLTRRIEFGEWFDIKIDAVLVPLEDVS
jgi:hypothetical protein